jgi:hypothetical protein
MSATPAATDVQAEDHRNADAGCPPSVTSNRVRKPVALAPFESRSKALYRSGDRPVTAVSSEFTLWNSGWPFWRPAGSSGTDRHRLDPGSSLKKDRRMRFSRRQPVNINPKIFLKLKSPSALKMLARSLFDLAWTAERLESSAIRRSLLGPRSNRILDTSDLSWWRKAVANAVICYNTLLLSRVLHKSKPPETTRPPTSSKIFLPMRDNTST